MQERLTPDVMLATDREYRMLTRAEYAKHLEILRAIRDAKHHGLSAGLYCDEASYIPWIAIARAGLLRRSEGHGPTVYFLSAYGELYLRQRETP